MKKEIVGIVILMLVTTTVVSATNIAVKENNQPTSVGVDVPVWEIGDTWIYNQRAIEYRYTQNGTVWFLLYRNATLTWEVKDDTGDNYTMKITSKNIEGSITIGSIRLKFTPLTKFTFEIIFRKTDLAELHESWQEKGLVFWLLGKIGIPIPAQYKRTWEYAFDGGIILPFPLIAGTNGTLPEYSYTAQSKCSLYWGLITLFDHPVTSYSAPPELYHCEMADITVPAGNFSAYNVSVDQIYGAGHSHVWRYYVPEVGFLAKNYIDSDWDISGKPYSHYELELVSTTYTP
jgi:hypothetical protein